MKTGHILVSLVLALGVHSTPVTHQATSDIVPRKLTHYDIRWCAKEKFKSCAATSLELDVEKCYDLRGGADNNAESMQKGGGVSCQVYDEKGCQGAFLQVDGDVKRFPSEWKNKISSFKCSDKDGK